MYGPGNMVSGQDICTGAELYMIKLGLIRNHLRLPAWPLFGVAERFERAPGLEHHPKILRSAESGQQIWQDLTSDPCPSFDRLVWSPTGCSFAYTLSYDEQQRGRGAFIRLVRFM